MVTVRGHCSVILYACVYEASQKGTVITMNALNLIVLCVRIDNNTAKNAAVFLVFLLHS